MVYCDGQVQNYDIEKVLENTVLLRLWTEIINIKGT